MLTLLAEKTPLVGVSLTNDSDVGIRKLGRIPAIQVMALGTK